MVIVCILNHLEKIFIWVKKIKIINYHSENYREEKWNFYSWEFKRNYLIINNSY